jgi:hypothetical protein
VLFITALAAIGRLLAWIDRFAGEVAADPAAFFRRYRGLVTVFVTSLVVSGLVTVIADRFSAHL